MMYGACEVVAFCAVLWLAFECLCELSEIWRKYADEKETHSKPGTRNY